MNNYELMVIFTPVLSDDEFKAAQKKFTTLVTDNGGQIVAENAWGPPILKDLLRKATAPFDEPFSRHRLLYAGTSENYR